MTGDGVVNPAYVTAAGVGEQCDDGAGNSDVQADACRTDCLLARCGDGVQDASEACDGGDNGDVTDGLAIDTPGCDRDCTAPVCGDGVHNAQAIVTGDPVLMAAGVTEQCDDGAANADDMPDRCRTNCLTPYCGDGQTDTTEACDAGEPATDPDPLDGLARNSVDCDLDCTLPLCPDEVHNPDAGEACDDGNTSNADACVAGCLIAYCGDGYVYAGVEECDDGAMNDDDAADACRTTCVSPYCGDGVHDTGETCDDTAPGSNTDSGCNETFPICLTPPIGTCSCS